MKAAFACWLLSPSALCQSSTNIVEESMLLGEIVGALILVKAYMFLRQSDSSRYVELHHYFHVYPATQSNGNFNTAKLGLKINKGTHFQILDQTFV